MFVMGELSVPMAGTSRCGSSKSASPGQTEPLQGLHFSSVCVDVADKRILWDVTGHSLPGRVLAIMGPSGEPVVGACCRQMAGQQCTRMSYILAVTQWLNSRVDNL